MTKEKRKEKITEILAIFGLFFPCFIFFYFACSIMGFQEALKALIVIGKFALAGLAIGIFYGWSLTRLFFNP